MDTERIKRRISDLDRIAATTPHADTRRDAQMQASALREKLPEGERDFTDKGLYREGVHWTRETWTRPPQNHMWDFFRSAMEQMEAKRERARFDHDYYARHHPIHGTTRNTMFEEDLAEFEYGHRTRTKEEILREYMNDIARGSGSFGKVKL